MGGVPISLEFGDGEHSFALPIGQLRELQDKTGRGPLALLRKIQSGEWFVDDLREVIRLGLIGGGSKAPDANKLVARYFDGGGHIEHYPLAVNILAAALTAPEGAKIPKAPATGTDAPATSED
jgi:hypothetical protein